ncbi:HD domain-containing protein [Prolixibacteraceae bacterium Z1-6]|uniref:HD domain-containing protein n=1 Tax=Draconibacterium aestuarii TaxID=2998507 RepID=A0A9X3F4M7_9BACT|nr:HD domain-containing protein [Prolixibacteraceae bacterium Z1-6]
MDSNIRQKELLFQTEKYIKEHFEGEGSGHDWWHIYRVRNLALKISKQEGGDIFIIEMAALLHDLDDWKLSDETNNSKTKIWLQKMNLPVAEIKKILRIIEQVSFKGAGIETKAISLEAQIVQDADRLDAIGAIGIARTFAYGGHKNRLMYDPAIKPEMHNSFEEYKKTTAPTINHFYEKLLLLKNRLNTQTAIHLAESRHRYMEDFLEHFFKEWDCNF